jgi:8-oxo-dGTP pyrophosphatase MutT (NUDIX family)
MKKRKDSRPRAELDREPKTQYAALPWRRNDEGVLEVLLITSRDTGRWVIPKGWPMKKYGPHRCAAQEAFEEAGVTGLALRKAVGVYHYDKRLQTGRSQHVRVFVFPMAVGEIREQWPEMGQRERRWMTPQEASGAVDEPELRQILAGFTPA